MRCHEAVELALHFQICNKSVIRRADFLVLRPALLTRTLVGQPQAACALGRDAGKRTSYFLRSVSFPKQFKWLVLGFFDNIVHENNAQCLPAFYVSLHLLVCFFHVLSDVFDDAQVLESTSALCLWQSVWEASESSGLPMSPVTCRLSAVSYFVGLLMKRRFWKVMAFSLVLSASTGQR